MGEYSVWGNGFFRRPNVLWHTMLFALLHLDFALASDLETRTLAVKRTAAHLSPSLLDTAASQIPLALDISAGGIRLPEEGLLGKSRDVSLACLKVGLVYPFSIAMLSNFGDEKAWQTRAIIAQWSFFERPFWPALSMRVSVGTLELKDEVKGKNSGVELVGSWGMNKLSFFVSAGSFWNNLEIYDGTELASEPSNAALQNTVTRFGLHYQVVPAWLALAGEASETQDGRTYAFRVTQHF